MKIRIALSLLLLCVLLRLPAAAQPTLGSTQFPHTEEVIIHDWINTAPNQTPDEGANVTWDLSQHTFNSLEDSGRYRNLSSTLPSWTYNLAFHYYGPTQPRFEFYESSASGLRYAGYARADLSIDTLILTSTSVLLPLPLSYGDSLTQPLAGHYVNNGSNVPVTGQTMLKADAWGTLILPWATYTDILRVHVRDSLNVFGFPQFNDSYYYYSAAEWHPVLVIQQKNPPTGYAIRPGAPVGIDDALLNEHFRAFPNPARDHLYLDIPVLVAGGRIQLLDMGGKVLNQWERTPGQGGLLQLGTAGLPRGMYLIRLREKDTGRTVHRKIVLQ